MRFPRLPLLALAAAILLAGVATPATSALAAPAPMVIYVSPTGDDANYGAHPDSAVKTLARAQSLAYFTRGDRPLEVVLAGGSYQDWGSIWYHYHPDFPTVIRASGSGGRPTYSGKGSTRFGLAIRPANYANMNLTVRGLSFWDGVNGIQVSNSTGVSLVDITLYRIGGKFAGGRSGVGALHLSNADGVRLMYSKIKNVENLGSEGPQIHGIYATAGSSGLEVRWTEFSTISGDPVRLRDGSDNAVIAASTFSYAGSKSIVSDWYNKSAGERPSTGSRFGYSQIGVGYDRVRLPDTYCFDLGAQCPSSRIWGFHNSRVS